MNDKPTGTIEPVKSLPPITLTPKEEMAVVVERIKFHAAQVKDETAKARLEIATDLIRGTIHRM